MADTKLTALTGASAPADADILYIVQGGASRKTTFLDLKNGILGAYTGTKGFHRIPVVAGSMSPSVTGGCGAFTIDDGEPNIPHLPFADSVDTSAEFLIPFPPKVTNITQVAIVFSGPTSGNVVWQVEHADADGGGANNAIGWIGSGQVTATSAGGRATAIVSTWDSDPAPGLVNFFKVTRLGTNGGDTASGSVKLLWVEIRVETTAEVDG